MKKTNRIGVIIKILSDHPNQLFSLKYFCDFFDAAKSSISEDIKSAKEILLESGLGIIETIPGVNGGVKLIPYISDQEVVSLQNELCEKLSDKSRHIGSGFLYTSDVMFDATLAKKIATVFCRKFQEQHIDFVTTIETKGIPIATMTAHLLNVPLVVIRRESKISEGSTVSINYFSGVNERIQKMSISKRAIINGSKALIIDDFMRGGGSIKGITELLAEFDISVVGTGIVMTSTTPNEKKVNSFVPLLYLEEIVNCDNIKVFPNNQIF